MPERKKMGLLYSPSSGRGQNKCGCILRLYNVWSFLVVLCLLRLDICDDSTVYSPSMTLGRKREENQRSDKKVS